MAVTVAKIEVKTRGVPLSAASGDICITESS